MAFQVVDLSRQIDDDLDTLKTNDWEREKLLKQIYFHGGEPSVEEAEALTTIDENHRRLVAPLDSLHDARHWTENDLKYVRSAFVTDNLGPKDWEALSTQLQVALGGTVAQQDDVVKRYVDSGMIMVSLWGGVSVAGRRGSPSWWQYWVLLAANTRHLCAQAGNAWLHARMAALNSQIAAAAADDEGNIALRDDLNETEKFLSEAWQEELHGYEEQMSTAADEKTYTEQHLKQTIQDEFTKANRILKDLYAQLLQSTGDAWLLHKAAEETSVAADIDYKYSNPNSDLSRMSAHIADVEQTYNAARERRQTIVEGREIQYKKQIAEEEPMGATATWVHDAARAELDEQVRAARHTP